MYAYNLDTYSLDRFGVTFAETKLGALVAKLPFALSATYGPWIAGGAVRKFAMGANIRDGGDVDIFFPNAAKFEKVKLDLSGLPQVSTSVAENGRTIDFALPDPGMPIISIVRGSFYAEGPRPILEDMTLTCTQFAIDRENMYVGPYAMQDAARRVLRINKPEKLAFSAKHIRRYLEKGFRIDDDRILSAVVNAGNNPVEAY